MSDLDDVRAEKIALAQSFRAMTEGPSVELALARLERFCHATTTTAVVGDPFGSAQLEGRRQVWLMIQAQRGLTNDEADLVAQAVLEGEIA